jgi:hypothetical protein
VDLKGRLPVDRWGQKAARDKSDEQKKYSGD